jgi:hypothetical protein
MQRVKNQNLPQILARLVVFGELKTYEKYRITNSIRDFKALYDVKNILSEITLMPMIHTDQWILEDKEERSCTDQF